jgi:hypothetical protein
MTAEPITASPYSPEATADNMREPGQDGQQQIRPARSWRKPVAIAAVVVAVGVSGAFAADVYAKNRICGALQSATASSRQAAQSQSAGIPNTEGLRKEIGRAQTPAKFLIFDADLKNAVNTLATDADRLSAASASLQKAAPADKLALVPQVMAVAGNANLHVRDAQRACGQPQTGIAG